MTRTKSIIGALVLCALSICAFAATSASASELTAVTCKEVAAGSPYNTNQCLTPAVPGNFDTVALPVKTPTEITITNTEAEPMLRATIGGVAVTVQCKNSEGSGNTITNEEPAAGKHKVVAKVGRNTYTSCTAVVKANEARNCLVEEVTGPNPGTIGMISTTALKGETTGVEHRLKLQPEEGTLFSKFNILNKTKGGTECPFNADVPVEVTGSVEGEANTTTHSHLTFTEANNGTLLKANGGNANYLDTVGGFMKGTTNVVGVQTFT